MLNVKNLVRTNLFCLEFFLLFYTCLKDLIATIYLWKKYDFNRSPFCKFPFSEFAELIEMKKIVTAHNKEMAFIKIKTFYGHDMDAVIFPSEWIEFNNLLVDGQCLFIEGELMYQDGKVFLDIKNAKI
jgi:hypothetical protein